MADSDLVVLVLAASAADPVDHVEVVTQLAAVLKSAPVGPYAVEGVAVAPDPAAAAALVDAVQASTIGLTLLPTLAHCEPSNVQRLRAFAANLAEVRGVAFRAASGLRLVQLAMKSAPSSNARTELLDRIDVLQQELPVLVEMELLREIVAGRAALPRWLRHELTRLFVHPEPTRRLGLDPSVDAAHLRDAVEATSTGWRVLENTGRIPFSARKAMLVAQQTLDRLHAELAYYG